MHRLILLAALVSGCARSGTDLPVYRAQGTPIWSNAVFEPERLAGRWVQVADFAPPGAAPCTAGGLGVAPPDAGRLGVVADLCIGGQRRGFDGTARVTGAGRLTLDGADPAGLGAEWWVLWVDDGYRTMAIGTPSGRFGMILDRQAQVPDDRMAAARDILDWNGYDLALLRAVSPR